MDWETRPALSISCTWHALVSNNATRTELSASHRCGTMQKRRFSTHTCVKRPMQPSPWPYVSSQTWGGAESSWQRDECAYVRPYVNGRTTPSYPDVSELFHVYPYS